MLFGCLPVPVRNYEAKKPLTSGERFLDLICQDSVSSFDLSLAGSGNTIRALGLQGSYGSVQKNHHLR